jgi:hypothetical protein
MRAFPKGKHRIAHNITILLSFVDLLAIIPLTFFVVVVPAGSVIWYCYGVPVYRSVLCIVCGWYL